MEFYPHYHKNIKMEQSSENNNNLTELWVCVCSGCAGGLGRFTLMETNSLAEFLNGGLTRAVITAGASALIALLVRDIHNTIRRYWVRYRREADERREERREEQKRSQQK